ncbi:hypothetical protein REPUB_Repub07fG0041100 [Reevesia pubescens]
MEPSKIFGGNEECHSCESGWTMYIGSPIQGGDDDDDDGNSEADDAYVADNNGGFADETDANHEADSDDSMASDASSGPSHQGLQFYGNIDGVHGHGTSHFKHDEDDKEEADCYLDNKAKKSSMEKQKVGMKKKEEKEQMTLKEKGASTQSRSGSKGKLYQHKNLDIYIFCVIKALM